MRLVLTIPTHGKSAEPRWISLREEGIDVGGASDCDAIVDDPSVGTARVRIERLGEHWVVIDREGRGACSVGGVALRAREPRIVRPPHALRLGDLELALAFDPLDSQDGATRDVALRAAAFVADVAPARPRVRVVEGPSLGKSLELSHAGPYRIGRGKSCDLFLDADDASREHFSVTCEGERVVVRDLGSARGTFLGRSRLEPNRGAVWDPSRMLRAADSVFALEVATPEGNARLLEPLARVGEGPPRTTAGPSEAPGAPGAPEQDGAESPDLPGARGASNDAAVIAVAPASGKDAGADLGRTDAPRAPTAAPMPSAPGATTRNDSTFILVAALALGLAGLAFLVALFVW